MGKYFGTDGFRGEANVTLTVEHAYKVGRYLGWYFNRAHEGKRAKIIIGKDTRRSSYMFEYSLVAGLTASGADAYLLHVTTTPSVAYVVRSEEFDCGIMITASHNPFFDNGIKVIDSKGHKMNSEVEELIEQYIDGEIEELPLATKENIGCTVDYSMGRNRYIGYLMSIPTRAFKDIRVGLDCSNGASSAIAKSVFDALGAKTYVINNEPDGLNINTNCGSTHIEVLQEYVRANNLDLGFAYDGDADRCIAVDEFGRVVDGDGILYVCGKHMMQHGELSNDTVVTTIMANLGLYKAFDREGIKYEKTAVGDKYVNECMAKYNHTLGGEQSGHVIFAKNATTGDGILTSLKVMEAVVESKKTLAQLLADLDIFPQLMKNVVVRNKADAQNDVEVQEVIADIEKQLDGNGRVLVRESGTEPLIRVMVEAKTDEECVTYVTQIVDKIKERGHVVER